VIGVVYKYTDDEGIFSVKVARDAVENYLKNGTIPEYDFNEKFKRNSGVFTTINSYPEKELRGCIGFPEPIMPLGEALVKSAIYAATEDPRFTPLSYKELNHVVFEVSLLTPPEEIKVKSPDEYIKNIRIGEDGLIVSYGPYSGLLLPQVATEYSMDEKTFLEHTCMKAGLEPDCWRWKNIKIFKFQAEIFAEEKPKGEIKRVNLK